MQGVHTMYVTFLAILHFLQFYNFQASLNHRANAGSCFFQNNFSFLSGKAFIDLITQYGWESITILYEDNDSMMRLKEIFDITSEVS
jgi:hypothetical protein